MSITIGRVGSDVTLNNPSTYSIDGDVVTLAGVFRINSVADFKTLRQQMAGLVDNPWERWIPVTWSLDSTQDGYYRVVSASVDAASSTYRSGFGSYQVQLQQAPGYSAAWQESVLTGAARNGTPGGVTPSTWSAIQGLSRGAYDTPGGTPTAATRQGPSGFVSFLTDASYFYDARTLAFRAPANWYDMASTIKMNGITQVGRQLVSDCTTWSLSNGLITIASVGSSTTDLFTLTAPQGATPGTAGSAKTFQIGEFSGAWTGLGAGTASSVTITRNTPEECGIRLGLPVAAQDTVVVDLNLRRGSYFVNMTIGSTTATKYGIATKAVTAMTSITGGMRQTSDDGDHNRIVIASAKTFTTDLVNGILYLTSAGTFHDFMVGMEVNGSSAAAPNRATDLRDQFFAAISETQSVIAR